LSNHPHPTTILASGAISLSDELSVQLVQPANKPARILIVPATGTGLWRFSSCSTMAAMVWTPKTHERGPCPTGGLQKQPDS
jgi:hypothetical protein